MRDAGIMVRVPALLRERLDYLVGRDGQGRTRSALIREALDEYCTRRESAPGYEEGPQR